MKLNGRWEIKKKDIKTNSNETPKNIETQVGVKFSHFLPKTNL